MTLGEYLYAALQPLVAGRCYPAGTADSTALPRITYSVVGGTPINYVEDTLADHELPRVQLLDLAASREEFLNGLGRVGRRCAWLEAHRLGCQQTGS